MLPPHLLSVLRPSNLSADMALAKEYHGKKSFPLPLHTHYILFLGHWQPKKQSFQQLVKKKGVDGKGRRQRRRAEKQEPLSKGPTQRAFPSHCSCHWRSWYTVTKGDSTRKDLGIPHYQDIKAYFLDFCFFNDFKFSPLSLGPVQNHSNFCSGWASYCLGRRDHMHIRTSSSCLGCVGVCTKALKRFQRNCRQQPHPLPLPVEQEFLSHWEA